MAAPAESVQTRWPLWFAPMGLLAALVLAGLGAAVVQLLVQAAGATGHTEEHASALGGTLVQDLALAGVALLLARSVASPAPADFGLRRVPVRALWAWATGGLVTFFAVSALWGLAFGGGDQDTLETLGAGEAAGYLWASGVLVVLVAPLVEEIFFRGFCFRAVRNRYSFAVAAVSVSVVFASLHYAGDETLVLLPPLALLGVMLCWLYERTGSLWPSVLFHMLNNALAFGVTAGSASAVPTAVVLVVVGAAGCTVAARSNRFRS